MAQRGTIAVVFLTSVPANCNSLRGIGSAYMYIIYRGVHFSCSSIHHLLLPLVREEIGFEGSHSKSFVFVLKVDVVDVLLL